MPPKRRCTKCWKTSKGYNGPKKAAYNYTGGEANGSYTEKEDGMVEFSLELSQMSPDQLIALARSQQKAVVSMEEEQQKAQPVGVSVATVSTSTTASTTTTWATTACPTRTT